MFVYKRVEDVKQYILNCILGLTKINVKKTIRDFDIFGKLTYDYNKERNKPHQSNYYPEIKIM